MEILDFDLDGADDDNYQKKFSPFLLAGIPLVSPGEDSFDRDDDNAVDMMMKNIKRQW